ncbi:MULTISPECIES: LysR substrate-binding domain-containing protein [unclassified Agarivorans]|uniref:LysR substrate-binding domain-containing protein n=1 Tax=unclassified Agarivorans TaxID=2636026 RepID=UPI0026E1A376|nr:MULTISPECIES: LysR substrate-binding domain-containing protein [unclassified Agarivorans]MDO6686550.1 LysR substrate-binding domain-containing protein [Agarivorans sp. 3_MG-2023]MDO6715368.1 LysR substrate-binding domain-containing protein [Agarivorans sp. 2_MG-2023]
MFQWDGINEFVAVVETQSFTVAAQRLGISTAQVSRQISQLETRLAIKLFYRTTRRVSVTDSGQLFYQQCRPLIEGLQDAERSLSQLQNVPRGSFSMTAPVTFGEQHIAPAVNDFCLQYPELQVSLQLTNQKIDLVDEAIDLAIRLGDLPDSSMMAKRLGERSLHVCASPAYLAQYGAPYSVNELTKHNCLQGNAEYWRFAEQGKSTTLKVRGRLRCNSGNALVDASLKGLGIVQLPDSYVKEHLQSGALVELLLPYQKDPEGIWALYPHNRYLSNKASLMLSHLQAYFAEV